MNFHDAGTSRPMSGFAFDRNIKRWAREIEDEEATRLGLPLPIVRKKLAREIGIAPGTLENIRRDRSKALSGRVMEAIRTFMVRRIEAEMGRLRHELELASAGNSNLSDAAIDQARSALEAAREIIEGGR